MNLILPEADDCRFYTKNFRLANYIDEIRVFTKDWFYLGDLYGDISKDEYAPKNTIMILTEEGKDDYKGFMPSMKNCPCMPVYDVLPSDMPLRKLTVVEKEIICLGDVLSKVEMLDKWKILFYDRYASDERFEDSEMSDIAYGFFIALGATPEEAYEMYEDCIKYGDY